MNYKVPESYNLLVATHPDVSSAALLPSRFGTFYAVGFNQTINDVDNAAFVKGDVVGKENVLIRMHSECLTGDAIGSLRCDCRDQLEGALRRIESEQLGVVLYLRQEGRGIGLTNKLKAYELQDQGLNTVEANLALGFADDMRDYEVAAKMIKALGIKSVRLLTNNPKKIIQLQKYGINVTERVEHIFASNEFNEFYLDTKYRESGHLLHFGMSAENYLEPIKNLQ